MKRKASDAGNKQEVLSCACPRRFSHRMVDEISGISEWMPEDKQWADGSSCENGILIFDSRCSYWARDKAGSLECDLLHHLGDMLVEIWTKNISPPDLS